MATLGFLQKLTLTPQEASADDIAALLAAGLSTRAIREALYVAFCFNVIDRLADAFEFELPTDGYESGAQFLLKHGYGHSSFPG
jgi:alkylhydroperoxidase family enzyme